MNYARIADKLDLLIYRAAMRGDWGSRALLLTEAQRLLDEHWGELSEDIPF